MAGALTISTLNNDTGVLATQNGMTGIAKAWLSYNGVTTTILGSFNVSSVTRSGVGNYTINFTTSMPNTNYTIASFLRTTETTAGITNIFALTAGSDSTKTTSALQVISRYYPASFDSPEVCVSVFSS
jgi:hypothetical protein